jgi:hypothetical protein
MGMSHMNPTRTHDTGMAVGGGFLERALRNKRETMIHLSLVNDGDIHRHRPSASIEEKAVLMRISSSSVVVANARPSLSEGAARFQDPYSKKDRGD